MALEGIGAATLPLARPDTVWESEQGSITRAEEPPGTGFSDMLADVVSNANQRVLEANAAGEAFAAGRSDDVHGTMIALSTADISVKMVGSIRNKVVDAFYEMWRMNV